jgi:hypothetical protein
VEVKADVEVNVTVDVEVVDVEVDVDVVQILEMDVVQILVVEVMLHTLAVLHTLGDSVFGRFHLVLLWFFVVFVLDVPKSRSEFLPEFLPEVVV